MNLNFPIGIVQDKNGRKCGKIGKIQLQKNYNFL